MAAAQKHVLRVYVARDTALKLTLLERPKSVEELKEKANALEKELSRTLAGYAEELRQVKWQDVQLHLKQTDAAIEFISLSPL